MAYHVSTSPHVRDLKTTRQLMTDVFIALLPAAVAGAVWFGWHALLLEVVCVAAAVAFEYIFQKCMKKEITAFDGSAAVTGLLLAMNLPSQFPVWKALLGAAFAIIVVKQLYGGIGQNFMNPALGGRVFLSISFAGSMTNFSLASGSLAAAKISETVSSATPLALAQEGVISLKDVFLGTTLGVIGETSAFLLILGGVYLLVRKVIQIHIPLAYLGSFLIMMILFSPNHLDAQYLAGQLFSGGLMLGAFFMATDYVTSPITEKGKVIFGVLLGVLTAIFRLYGSSAEGVSYAIIIGNLLVPLIEKVTRPVAFGREGGKHGKKE
ncbi:MAG: RnfABCDGE type electron transport complex subunit D [Lachnospiraceae bacterium]|nr:RnfABCDGE type electron transport complex subunit D [Lachnospiraceae bacterium]